MIHEGDNVLDDDGKHYVVTEVHTRLWWRAVGPNYQLWCESSDEQEVREAAARAPEDYQPIRIQVLRRYTITPGWEDAS